jgi:hypothetical protein
MNPSTLGNLPPFTARIVEQLFRRRQPEKALALIRNSQNLEPEAPIKPDKSAGLLIAEQLRSNQPNSGLPCPSDDDPRWQQCKHAAARRIRLKSAQRLPFKTHHPRHGERPGPGAFVALLLALALYYQDHPAQRRCSIFAVQWAVAKMLGVSADTIQRWQRLPETMRWVQSWRYLDPGAEYRRAGMLYTVLFNPDHRHKPVQDDLLRLPLRSLRMAAAAGQTRRHTFRTQRPHKYTLNDVWVFIVPITTKSFQHNSFSLVDYVAAMARSIPVWERRRDWLESLVRALTRHLGSGQQPLVRQKLYWRIALTCLRASLEGNNTPLLQLKEVLDTSLKAYRLGRVRNLGAFFTSLLRRAGFFELAGFYQNRAQSSRL